jgi:hypothetical protein
MKTYKTKFICVSPISPNAKKDFHDEMDNFHSCRIKNENGDNIYLESLNKQYYFWMSKNDDKNWRIEK